MNTRYEKMHAELIEIIQPLNPNKCNVFEETFLRIANIVERPSMCRFENEGDNHCLFSLSISTETAQQLIFFYSQAQFDGLNISDVTEVYKTIPQKARHTLIENIPTRVIIMRADILQKKILPLIKNDLLKNPD